MSKDPAVLFYKDKWLLATAEMDADAKGWYLNLILHNYDKGSLPNDPEKLAVLAGVRFSEYARFEQVLQQVLLQKFSINEANGRLENGFAAGILKAREEFKEKRERSANIGVVIKNAKNIKGFTEKHIKSLKSDLYSFTDEQIEEAKSEQVLEQMLKLYINVNVNKDNTSLITKGGVGENEVTYYRTIKHLKLTFEEFEKLLDLGYSKEDVDKILDNIQNYKKNTNYSSLFLTAKNWLEKDATVSLGSQKPSKLHATVMSFSKLKLNEQDL